MSDHLKEILDTHAARTGCPGVAVGVYVDGEELYAFHGVTSVENPLPVDANTLFSWLHRQDLHRNRGDATGRGRKDRPGRAGPQLCAGVRRCGRGRVGQCHGAEPAQPHRRLVGRLHGDRSGPR